MHDLSLSQVLETVVHSEDNSSNILLPEDPPIFESFFQITLTTQLGDDVAIVCAFEDLMAVYDVGVVEGPNDGDFLL